jgi:hypothetical protein
MNQLIIKNSNSKYILLLLMTIGIVAGSAWLVSRGDRVGWLGLICFGPGIPLFIRQLLDTRPRLVIDESGVLDRTLGVGRIAWGDIESAYVKSIKGNDFICLTLRNPEVYLGTLSPTRRAMATANRKLGFTEINLNLSGVAADTNEIYELVLKNSEVFRRRPPN